MHDIQIIAMGTKALRTCSGLALLAGAFVLGGTTALAAQARPVTGPASAAQDGDQGSTSNRKPRPLLAPPAKSPVLGPTQPDGIMGGTLPSAVPGWEPHPGDAEDAYVYVPDQGWLEGDTRQERQQ